MTLYLDTEFNGHGGELISMAIVSDKCDHFFYGVLPLPENIHPWVAENVIPKLGTSPVEYELFRKKLYLFLEAHKNEIIIADWPADFEHLMRCFCGDTFEKSFALSLVCKLDISDKNLQPKVPHNALSDAQCLKSYYISKTFKNLDAIR